MAFQQELSSWNPFVQSHHVEEAPQVGNRAPSTSNLSLPRPDRKPVVVAFLRHCGCPWAEKLFRSLRAAAEDDPDVHYIAISHSDETATSNWLDAVGGAGKVEVIVDHERSIYEAYGLGFSSFWHALNPWSMAAMIRLGRSEQIWNRPTESGSRWQTAGLFGIDGNGTLKYTHVAQQTDDLGDLKNASVAARGQPRV